MTWKRLIWNLVTSRRDLLGLLWVAALVAAVADVAMPWLLREGVDTALGTAANWSLGHIALAMMGVVGLITLMHVLGTVLETLLFSEASFGLRRRVYAHLYQQGRGFYQRHGTGELVNRVGNDIQLLEASMMELFSEMPFSVLSGLGIFLMMVMTDLRLTAVVVAFLVFATWLTEFTGRRTPSLRRLIQFRCGNLAGRLQESLGGMRTVQAFCAEAKEVARLDGLNARVRDVEKYEGLVRAISTPLWSFAELGSIVAVLWFAGSLVMEKQITVGTFVAFVAYTELLAVPLSKAGIYYYNYQTCRGLSQRIVSLLGDHDALPAGTQPGPADARRLSLEHVGFAYADPRSPLLDDVCLTLEPGKCVALVGRNGAGKTTLLDLLLRFRAPQEGRITAGGLDLAEWRPGDWRRRVGLMPQELTLFQGTVAENIAFGLDGVDPEAAERALLRAGGARLLDELPDGVLTAVGEGGTTLSGGQRQLIALARVLIRDPQVVLLDEPTANLDGDTLQAVGKALSEFVVGRTTLIVSHRPETIRLAHRIVVLDRGRIVAEGTHDQLWQDEEIYRQLLGGAEGASPALESVPAS